MHYRLEDFIGFFDFTANLPQFELRTYFEVRLNTRYEMLVLLFAEKIRGAHVLDLGAKTVGGVTRLRREGLPRLWPLSPVVRSLPWWTIWTPRTTLLFGMYGAVF